MEYYVLDHNNRPLGPFSLLKLRQMGINRKSYVWAQGWSQWLRAGDVEEINKYVLHAPTDFQTAQPTLSVSPAQPKQQPEPPKAPSVHQPAVSHPEQSKTQPQDHSRTISFVYNPTPDKEKTPTSPPSTTVGKPALSRRNRHLLTWATIIFALICLLTSTNPNIFAHRREAREVVEEAVQADISSGNTSGTDYPNGTSVDDIFAASLVYHNYYIFSTTTVQLRRTTHFLSLGILGQVFTVSPDML